MSDTALPCPINGNTPPAHVCLGPLLHALGWDDDTRCVREALPPDGIIADFEILQTVLGNLRIKTSTDQIELNAVQADDFPFLLTTDDGNVCVVLAREQNGFFQVFNGRQGHFQSLRPIEICGQRHCVVTAEREAMETAAQQLGLDPSTRPADYPLTFLIGLSILISGLTLTLPLYSLAIFDHSGNAGSTLGLAVLTAITAAALGMELFLRRLRCRKLLQLKQRHNRRSDLSSFNWLMEPNDTVVRGATGQHNTASDTEHSAHLLKSQQSLAAVFDTPSLGICLAMIFVIGGWIGWITATFAAFALLIAAAMGFRQQGILREGQRAKAETVRFRREINAHSSLIRSAGAEDLWTKRYRLRLARHLSDDFRAANIAANARTISGNTAIVAVLLTLGASAIAVGQNEMTLGALMAILILAWRSFTPIHELLAQPETLAEAWKIFASARKPSTKSHRDARQPATAYRKIRGQIELSGITLHAGKSGNKILNRVSLIVEPGEMVVISGTPEDGPACLLGVIALLKAPTAGEIRIDGFAAKHIHPHRLRRSIAFISSAHGFFPGSIRENFRLANPAATQEAIDQAIREADLGEFAEQLADGLETELFGADQTPPAEAVQQKIRLARAYIQDPAILVFDAPTNALDDAGRRAFISKLLDIKGQKTVILTTEDLELIALSDKVAKLSQGELVHFDQQAGIDAQDPAALLRNILQTQGPAPAGRIISPDRQSQAK